MRGRIAVYASFATLVLAMAQPDSTEAQSGYIGLKAGFVTSDVSTDRATSGEELGETSRRNGFSGGVVAGLRINPRVSVMAEGLYSQKGFMITEADVDGSFKIDVIEIPVLANLHLGSEGARVSPRLFAGPWVSFEASCNIEVGPLEAGCDEGEEGNERKKTDYGLLVGAALDIVSVGPVTLTADARYNAGFRNIDDSANVGNLNVKTRGFTFSAGVGIPLGE